eukprot:15366072-Ditylum_brightwellii.AAC.1
MQNTVKECSKLNSCPTLKAKKAMKQTMMYCAAIKRRGLMMKPNAKWDGKKEFKFILEGYSDSKYAKSKTRRSVNGWSVFMCDALISYKSKMMSIIALSVTESELFATVQCVQDRLFAMRVLNAMQLKVKLPTTLYVNNKGAKDFANNWSIGGRTRHVEVKQYFLQELKEAYLIVRKWKRGEDMRSDIFTKNCNGTTFERHIPKFVGEDKYMSDEHNTHKGKVPDAENCAYQEGTNMSANLH